MRHVVAAVEIIIDEDFPVALERIVAPLEPVKLFKVQGFKAFKEIVAQIFFQ